MTHVVRHHFVERRFARPAVASDNSDVAIDGKAIPRAALARYFDFERTFQGWLLEVRNGLAN